MIASVIPRIHILSFLVQSYRQVAVALFPTGIAWSYLILAAVMSLSTVGYLDEAGVDP